MISDTARLLVEVLRPALGGPTSFPEGVTAAQWREIYALAVKHNVQGILQEAVASADPSLTAEMPLDVAARLVSDSMTIAADHTRHRAAAAKLAAFWKQNGIDARMIKGLESAKYYPRPEARVLGDIDWWITRPEDWRKALDAVRALGTEPRKDSEGDVSFGFDGIVVELHRRGLDAPGAEGELDLLGGHVLHHATVFGAELRHICDYAVARRKLGVSLPGKSPRRWWRTIDSLADHMVLGTVPSKDAGRLLEITLDGSCAVSRALYYLRIAPGAYLRRIAGLAVGRIKRIF